MQTIKSRVMLLLNNTILRQSDTEMLHALGIEEIFTPKSFPHEEQRLFTEDVVYLHDNNLTIPSTALTILNAQNWYENPSQEAWDIANQYFDIIFITFTPRQMSSAIEHFKWQIILRAFDLPCQSTYTAILPKLLSINTFNKLNRIKNRFWFGSSYEHMKDNEGSFLRRRDCFLPIGFKKTFPELEWRGSKEKVLVVCSRLNTSSYHQGLYLAFKKTFKNIPYIIDGPQPIEVNDPNVSASSSKEIYHFRIREFKVMFYPETMFSIMDTHPFDAIACGMPVIFMAGSILDLLGGKDLVGCCKNLKEARKKVERVLKGDRKFIKALQHSQIVLLASIGSDSLLHLWKNSFHKLIEQIPSLRIKHSLTLPVKRKKRFAVIIPTIDACLQTAKLVAEALYIGSRQAGEPAEIVLGYLNNDDYNAEIFLDIHPEIKHRMYHWETLNNKTSNAAMLYANLEKPLHEPYYITLNDGINNFLDCDLLIFISDSLSYPLLPLTPYLLFIQDYFKSYESVANPLPERTFTHATYHAEKVIVTSELTKQYVLQVAGLSDYKIIQCPPLPSLASLYPILQKIDAEFQLAKLWMNDANPIKMELESDNNRKILPTKNIFEKNSIEKLSLSYWHAINII